MLTELHSLGAASEPHGGGAERDGRWLLKAIEDNRPENGDQDRRDAARDEAGHYRPLLNSSTSTGYSKSSEWGCAEPHAMLGDGRSDLLK